MDSSGTLVPLVLLVTVLLRCSADTGQHMRHFEAATALLSSGKYAAAISELSAAIKADPTFVQGFFHRGKLRKRLGNFRDSERDFEEVLRLSPSNVIAKQSIQDHKLQSLDAQKMEGRKAYAAADWKKALALLLPVSKEAPLSSDLRYEIAKSYYELGDYPNSFLYSGKHLELTGKSLDGILLRGMSCYHLGNDINAIKHFREGLSLDPENKQLKKPYKKLRKLRRVIDRAEEELSQGKSRKAIRSFREAIELEERVEVLKHLYLNLCRAQTKAKLFNEADKSCSKALEFDDSVVEAWTARGEARLKAEKFQEAVSDYTKAVELDPNNRDIQRSLQNAQLELKKSKRKNYYKILGVTKDASSRELKKAYRKLVKKLHPDKNIGKSDEEVQKAENEFREVNEAYDILVDPEKRKRFDSGEDMEDDGRGGGGHHGFGGFGDFSRGFNPDSGFNFPGGFHFKFG